MTLQLYPRQLSNNALTIDNGGQPFFIPKSFEHTIVNSYLVIVDVPKWFEDKHEDTLERIKTNTNITIKRLGDHTS
jgi:hypothetical protein